MRTNPYHEGGRLLGLADLLDVALWEHLDPFSSGRATMNSVVGNKERLAVSTRGKKYGVSCGGVHAEMRSRGLIWASVLCFPGAGGGCRVPSSRVHRRLRGRRDRARMEAGLQLAWLRECLRPLVLPFPHTLNFCSISGLAGRVKPRGSVSQEFHCCSLGSLPRSGEPF